MTTSVRLQLIIMAIIITIDAGYFAVTGYSPFPKAGWIASAALWFGITVYYIYAWVRDARS